ncbi:SWIM zinc finger domain-containing protein [Undibacterium arcticum]|uniref:SWIM zinc finger domain-containing protein n=1 Tax=Undibacterium arcticum TaxID=1762892 RepID=A0ABV7F319_9BURK
MSIHPQTDWRTVLSDSTLLALAGNAVFRRGQTYACSGAISAAELSYPDASITLKAQVRGTRAYTVELSVAADEQLEGDCDCPHAEDGNFCKHQVAVAMQLRQLLEGAELTIDPEAQKKVAAASKRAQTQASKRDALLKFLQEQTAQTLAERLWQIAEHDRYIMADLKAWFALSDVRQDGKSLKTALSNILKSQGFLDWYACTAYARRAEQILPLLEKTLQNEPLLARTGCEHALRCLYRVAEHADDSNGEIGGVLGAVMDLLLRSLEAVPPTAAWIENWFALMDADPWGLWNEAAVLEAAGPALVHAYSEKVAQDWQKWQVSQPKQETGKATASREAAYFSYDYVRSTLRRRYMQDLQRQGDVLAVIALMQDSARENHEHLELIKYCEDQNKMREALQFAQQAYTRYPDHFAVVDALLRCYDRDGWDNEAYAIRRKQLEKSPTVANYQAVLKNAKTAGLDVALVREGLFFWQIQEEQQALKKPAYQQRLALPNSDNKRGGNAGLVVSARVGWLLAENRVEEALALVQIPNRCAPELLHAIASRLPSSENQRAVVLLLRLFEHAMPGASTPYTQALDLIREILPRMPDSAQWLSQLRMQYKAKRNFIKGLAEL